MRKIEFNKSKDTEFRVLCPECKIETRHIVIQSADIRGREDYDETFSIDWESKHQILECQGCLTISYRDESSNSEDWDLRTGEPEVFVRLYPKRTKDTLFIKDFLNTSPNLTRIYREIIDSFNNQIFTLCAAGLRAIIEGICAEEGVLKDSRIYYMNTDILGMKPFMNWLYHLKRNLSWPYRLLSILWKVYLKYLIKL
jgi:hypothetical protein